MLCFAVAMQFLMNSYSCHLFTHIAQGFFIGTGENYPSASDGTWEMPQCQWDNPERCELQKTVKHKGSHLIPQYGNASGPGDACIQCTASHLALHQAITWSNINLFHVEPSVRDFSEVMIRTKNVLAVKCIWKYLPQNDSHFVQASLH